MIYREITQAELIDILKNHKMSTTPQTLRNWERYGILLSPFRGKHSDLIQAGRKAIYSEFALAECFATYHLVQGDMVVPYSELRIPQISLDLIAYAAQKVRSRKDYLPGYPIPQNVSYEKKLKPSTRKDEKRTYKFKEELLKDYAFKDYSLFLGNTITDFAVGAWKWALYAGCDQFLQGYRQ